MTDDNPGVRTSDFVHALDALDADVGNITAERIEQGMRVTPDLFDPDDADLVCDVAEEHCFDRYGDTGEGFKSQS